MKKLNFIGELSDGSFVFFIAYNDDPKDPRCGYFSQSKDRQATIEQLKPLALAEIKCNGQYLQDHEKANIQAISIYQLSGIDGLKEVAKGCNYDVKLHSDNCYAYHLQKACELQLHFNKNQKV